MNEQELQDIEAGLHRWNVCSPQVAQKLIAEVRRLRAALTAAWGKLDDAQDIIEQAQGKR